MHLFIFLQSKQSIVMQKAYTFQYTISNMIKAIVSFREKGEELRHRNPTNRQKPVCQLGQNNFIYLYVEYFLTNHYENWANAFTGYFSEFRKSVYKRKEKIFYISEIINQPFNTCFLQKK